MLPMDHSY